MGCWVDWREDQISQVVASVSDLNGRMTANEKRMDTIESLVEKKIKEGFMRHGQIALQPNIEEDFPCLPGQSSNLTGASLQSSYATALSFNPESSRIPQAEHREREYWTCRRSLRIRLIETKNGDRDRADARSAVLSFMEDRLKKVSSTISSLGDFHVEMIPQGPENKAQERSTGQISNR